MNQIAPVNAQSTDVPQTRRRSEKHFSATMLLLFLPPHSHKKKNELKKYRPVHLWYVTGIPSPLPDGTHRKKCEVERRTWVFLLPAYTHCCGHRAIFRSTIDVLVYSSLLNMSLSTNLLAPVSYISSSTIGNECTTENLLRFTLHRRF